MAAPSSALSAQATSTTSSGFADGLGRRILAFDREEGVMLERLVLRPELVAFESILRDRIERLGSLEDERLARPRTIDREVGGVVVVSEFVPGSRLSDLLETSAELGHAPGVDAALGFLLDILPALCGLHAAVGFAHGTITPSRTVLTPAGQIVLLDGIYAEALTHLRYSRSKLWLEFGIATAPGAPRLDERADIAQAALAAVMLIVGRPLRADEYLSGLSGVLREVVEIAQIRSTAAFADGFRNFLERALPRVSPNRYKTADDALFDARHLANELGAQACRRALVEFIEQMESPTPASGAEAQYDDVAAAIEGYGFGAHSSTVASENTEPDLNGSVEAELDLDSLVEPTPYDMTSGFAIEIDEAEAPGTVDDEAVDWVQLAAASAAPPSAPPPVFEPRRVEPEVVERPVTAPPVAQPVIEQKVLEQGPVEQKIAEPRGVEPKPVQAPIEDDSINRREPTGPQAAQEASAPAAQIIEPVAEVAAASPAVLDPAAAVDPQDPAADEPPSEEPVSGLALRWRRAKRATRSVRARKDKLRSVSESDAPAVIQAKPPAPDPLPPPPPPPPAPEPKKPASGSWLVAPDRAAAFEPVVPDSPTFAPEPQLAPPAPIYTQPPAPVYTPPAPAPVLAPPPVPLYVPPPPAPVPTPVEPVFSRTVGSIAPSYDTPPAWTPPTVKPASPVPVTPQLTAPKLKDAAPRPRPTRAPDPVADIYSSSPAASPSSEPSGFPWKLAAAAAVIMVAAIVGGKVYLPAKGEPPEGAATAQASSPSPAPSGAPAGRPGVGSVVANTGRLEVETQPAGARILIDGKAAGESPVALDGIPAGRHTVTFVTPSGSVKRTIRIEAGRTTKLDVPIFSGWVGIYAPFVLEVVEGGRVIGTTEESRILLSPGKHDLTLVNRELGYSSAQTVEIEPGEVKSISIDPRGQVNLNASPWAEVWIEGRKVGDTPMANLQLPLGVREVTFRHPQFGERKVTLTVKGNAPAAISIDMSKP
jgi:PEGA domain